MSGHSKRAFLFAGPTLYGVPQGSIDAGGVVVLPPAKRNDIARLVAEMARPETIILVDGVFHSHAAPGHIELRSALQSGWRVFGVSSMGAIRASEMEGLGMVGFGEVFELFRANPDFSDDEVTLLHKAVAPFTPFSEPMVHIRALLDYLSETDRLDRTVAHEVCLRLKDLWFGYRTVEQLRDFIARGREAPSLNEIQEALPRCRVKTHDLTRFLEERVWEK